MPTTTTVGEQRPLLAGPNFAGVFYGRPTMGRPVVVTATQDDAGPLPCYAWTCSCGAVSRQPITTRDALWDSAWRHAHSLRWRHWARVLHRRSVQVAAWPGTEAAA